MKTPVMTGADVLSAEDFSRLHGKRVGILGNAAAVDRNLRHIVDLLASNSRLTAKKIFAPEHGFRGAAQDMIAVGTMADSRTKLPIVSLYGNTPESLAPKREDLSDLDALVVDLPDIGTRYYTYAQTMSLAMKAAGESGVKVYVLDRPNPLGGISIEGAPLLKSCRSFCGFTPVANRHGLTLGELALIYQRGFGDGEDRYPAIPCELEIVRLSGWNRTAYFDQTGLPWVIPSPNIPALESALVYPGACLFECTNISEGRGTTLPFALLGAPFIDGFAWAEETVRSVFDLRGAILRPVWFTPQFHKWKGEYCGGVQIHVTDRESFQPFRWSLALIAALRRLYPEQFRWRRDPYEFVKDVPAIDLLYGNPVFREAVDGSGDLAPVAADLEKFEQHFSSERQEFLLYR